jgi:hypothetical protein
MSNPSTIKKTAKVVAVFFVTLIALIVMTRIGLGLVSTQSNLVGALDALTASPFILIVRLSVYTGLYFGWPHLLRIANPKLSDSFIKSTRRPLIVLIVLYEILFVQKWLSIFSGSVG